MAYFTRQGPGPGWVLTAKQVASAQFAIPRRAVAEPQSSGCKMSLLIASYKQTC